MSRNRRAQEDRIFIFCISVGGCLYFVFVPFHHYRLRSLFLFLHHVPLFLIKDEEVCA